MIFIYISALIVFMQCNITLSESVYIYGRMPPSRAKNTNRAICRSNALKIERNDCLTVFEHDTVGLYQNIVISRLVKSSVLQKAISKTNTCGQKTPNEGIY